MIKKWELNTSHSLGLGVVIKLVVVKELPVLVGDVVVPSETT